MLYLVKFQDGSKIEINAAYYRAGCDGFVHFYIERPEIGVKYDAAISINTENIRYVKEVGLDIKEYEQPKSYYASHDITVTPTRYNKSSTKDWEDDGVIVTAKNEVKS